MYARLDRFSGQRGHGVDDPDLADLGSSAAGQPGLLGRVTFRQLAGRGVPYLVGLRGQRHQIPRTSSSTGRSAGRGVRGLRY